MGSDILAAEADRFNHFEINGNLLASLEGEGPKRPIRKRGYHRAVKRGELWALARQADEKMMRQLATEMYANYLNTFLELDDRKFIGIRFEPLK